MDSSQGDTVPDAVSARAMRPDLAARALALAPATALLVAVSFVQIASQSGAGGYDATADWVTVNAAFDGLDLSIPVVTLAGHYDVTLEAIGGQEESVHPRTPGGLLLMSPLVLVEPEIAYPLWVVVGAVSMVVLMFWVAKAFALSLRETLLGSLLVVPAGYTVSGSLEFGSLSPLIAVLAFAYWRAIADNQGWAGGLALGTAAALKVYPATLLLAAFAFRRWRILFWGVGSIILLNVGGLLVFDTYSIGSYLDALSLAAQQWIPFQGNLSLAGVLAGAGVSVTWASVSGVVVIVSLGTTLLWRKEEGQDLVLGLLVTATLIGWPMVWGHYMILAVPVVAWLLVSGVYRRSYLGLAWLISWVVLPPILDQVPPLRSSERFVLGALQLVLMAALWRGSAGSNRLSRYA